ncbi:MAG: hypothetical protein EBS56_02375, partial [Planctomycetia bacterium]|nr:hypothetical protein [Planctomycetia bacterium]
NNCSYYCHQASGVGLASVIGTGAGTVKLDDMEHADCVFLIGGNPASNHPRMMRTLMMVRRSGGKVIVVNPIVETGMVNFSVPSDAWALLFGAEIASTYVQPYVGGDLAMVYGIMKRLRELHAASPLNAAGEPVIDEDFLHRHCVDWPALATRLDALSWDEIVRKSGVSQREIFDMAAQYAESKRAVFAWTARPHAADGGAAGCRTAADPRPFEHPGHGHRGCHANAQEGDLRAAREPLRRQATHGEGLRHAGMPRRGRRGHDAVRLLPRWQSLRREP